MAECDECGEYENLPYQCRRCGQTFCADHRLPENHDCPGLNEWNDPGGVFEREVDTKRSPSESSARTSKATTRSPIERVQREVGGLDGLLAYFRGNATYTFLALMWVTFAVQYAIYPALLGIDVPTRLDPSPLWTASFVLSPEQPLYAWTWFTSIFSHGGFGHIAVNSIALYFFGPPVERRLGTRRYLALFLGGGIIAAFSQVGLALVPSLGLGLGTAGVLGASGAIMAVMGVLTVLNPGLRVYLYFIIPMPLWVLTFGFAAFSLLAGFGNFGGNAAHFAHLGGLIVGLAYGNRIKGETRAPDSLQLGGGPGGPGGPGRRR